jgi:hypothetical protein
MLCPTLQAPLGTAADYLSCDKVSLNAPIYGFYPAVVLFDSESCDSIILLNGFGCKVLFVALGLSSSHKRYLPQSANGRGEPSTT